MINREPCKTCCNSRLCYTHNLHCPTCLGRCEDENDEEEEEEPPNERCRTDD